MLKKIFSIDKDENLTVKICGKTALTYYNHLIMEVTRDEFVCDFCKTELVVRPFETDVLEDMRSADFGAIFIERFKKTNSDKINGLALYTQDGEICGYICGLLPKCDEIQYRIRDCEFFVKYVYVFERFRGMRIASELFRQMFLNIDKQNITFAVRKNNLGAIKAYKRLGARVIGKKKFIRIWKIKIPYVKL